MGRQVRNWVVALALVAGAVTGRSISVEGQEPVGLVSLARQKTWMLDGVEVLPVRGQVYMVAGAGGNVAVQVGDEGLLFVDTGAAGQSSRILNAVRLVSDAPVRWVINTSGDADFIGGNGAIVAAGGGIRGPAPNAGGGNLSPGQNNGVLTIAQENASLRMVTAEPGRPALEGDAIPASTFFTPRKQFYANHEALELLYQPAAHTDGNILVFFRGSDVIATGDLFRTDSYPVIDTAHGGTIQGEIDALNAIVQMAVPERNQMGGTRVIPGHGHIGNQSDVVEYRDMVTIVRDRIRDLKQAGKSLAEVKAARPTLEYDGLYGATTGPWTTDMFIETVYRQVGSNTAAASR